MIAWAAPLVAADIEPYLKLIGLIVAVSIMAINHLLAGLKKARAQLPPPPDASAPQNPVAAAATRQDLNAEVKEFLRRANQNRSGQRGPQTPARQATPVAPAGGQRNEGPRKQKRKSQQPKPAVSAVPTLDDSLAKRRMTSRLETSSLDERTEQLTNLDRQSEINAHVQETLDHQVGQLTTGSASSATRAPISEAAAGIADFPSNSVADIAALLSNPQSIRTAMILNEILTRPADRW